MRRLLAVVVLGAVVAAAVLTGASDDGDVKRYKVQLDNAFGLVEGGDVKVGGVRVGQTTDFDVDDSGERSLALAEIEISEHGFGDFRTDATCRIRPQSLIGEFFLDCQPGDDPERLPEGGTVPVEQTEGTINTDLINNVLRRPFRERFRLILAELGTGLAGRPDDLNEVVRRAHPGLRETTKTLRLLARQSEVIQDFIRDSDTVLRDLADRKEDVARWVEEAGETSEISASRREALAEQFRRFPTLLDELEPTMVRLGELADEQIPALRDLQTAAPDLERFFRELGPFARESLPSIRSLGRAARTGRAALDESKEEIDELRQLAENAPAFAEPLSDFLISIDDRDRFTEPDRRAAETAPPAPDPTADADGKGFTGMEAILNYPYWQELAINQFDEIGHLLRVVAFESECGVYHTGSGIRFGEEQDEETQALFDRCRAWMGKTQPGITAPDPTADGAQAAVAERRTSGRARRAREADDADDGERAALEPEEPAAPGQRDLSKPEITLLPGLQELVDSLPDLVNGERVAPPDQSARTPDAAQLLDFLLAP